MKILWFTWKDGAHPQAGGAEVVNEELAKRLVRDGHEIVFVVGGFDGCVAEEVVDDGFRVVRLGNRYSVYWTAYKYYKKHLQGWADIVIEEVNTVPFFTQFYVQEKRVYLFYQLCREVWHYQMQFPLNWIGYFLEPLYLKIISWDDKLVFTESKSAKDDLVRHGFKNDNVQVFPVGINTKPLEGIESIQKYDNLTVLSLGAIREMKRTLHQVKAFEIAKKTMPDLQMKIAGDASGEYGQKVARYIQKSKYAQDIEFLGRVSAEKKMELMQKSHCILVTSIKEGWGLIVTEAASQGTPAVVYNIDGLRDSVKHDKTGIISSENNPSGLAVVTINLLSDSKKYDILRSNAWRWSHEFTFENGYKIFIDRLIK